MEMEKCKRYEECNAPICPLDPDARIRIRMSEDDICVYCRTFKAKGKRLAIPLELRKLVPENNVSLLREKNRKVS